ncbi:isoprenoid synthase domain-containing protein, partial [Cyathus striatus]
IAGKLNVSDRSAEFVRYTDVADGKMADEMAARVVDASGTPTRREEGDIVGNYETSLPPKFESIEHFITGFEEYIEAVAQEADDRAHKRIRTVKDYQQLRRGTTSGKAIFALIEFGLDLPEEVLDHPTVVRMTEAALEICGITNDMHSYRLEHARGLDGHNIITSIIHEHRLNLQIYVDGLGNWVRGNDCWCYESKRYYGDGGEIVRQTGIITLKGGTG